MELSKIGDWKQFERFSADLMQAEGFSILSEPFVDQDGVDFLALEKYKSHATDRVIEVKWRVQCKHYATSGNCLRRSETQRIIYNYETSRELDEGLFIIVSTDYSSGALNSIEKYVENKKDAKICIWNERQILVLLERHPEIAKRYGLQIQRSHYEEELSVLGKIGPKKILVISDQSVFAHNLVRGFGAAGFEVVFIPFWNYHISSNYWTLSGAVELQEIDMAVCFLGDSFGYPMPDSLISFVKRLHENNTPVLFFPFFAWSINRGGYVNLDAVLPVSLADPATIRPSGKENPYLVGPTKLGDFRFLLEFDSFAEDQYVEFEPELIDVKFRGGISKKFGISHSFEYLNLKEGSKIVCQDTSGNPIVVVSHKKNGKVVYFNSCCHSCLTLTPVSSPLEASNEFTVLLRNVLEWLLE